MGAGCTGTKDQATFDQRAQIRHSNGIGASRRDLAIAVVQHMLDALAQTSIFVFDRGVYTVQGHKQSNSETYPCFAIIEPLHRPTASMSFLMITHSCQTEKFILQEILLDLCLFCQTFTDR